MMYAILWNFFIYAFLGWCMEVSYAALVSGKFVNRGFLNGPVCPIYGFGAVIVLSCLEPLKDNWMLLFVGSVVLTSLLELITGFVLEKLFHQRWWDYSDMPFNIGGYICLLFSILWGFACLFVVKILHPSILFLVHLIPHTVGIGLLAVMGVIMAVDIIATVKAISGINHRLSQIDELAGKIKAASNEFGENLADRVLEAAERGSELKEDLDEFKDDLAERRMDLEMDLDELKDDLAERRMDLEMDLGELKDELTERAAAATATRQEHRAAKRAQLESFRKDMQDLLEVGGFGQRRLLRAFPSMRSTDHKKALERLRRRMDAIQDRR